MSVFEISPKSDFSVHNIPFGVFSLKNQDQKICATRLGDYVIDLNALEQQNVFNGQHFSALKMKVFDQQNLNRFMSLGQEYVSEVRKTIQKLFNDKSELLSKNCHKIQDVQMHLPCHINDYTDFYSSYNHAYNVGCLIRGPANAIQENWKHLPVGYHGRASSVVLSGTEIRRPRGQAKAKDATVPSFGECKRFDYELEIGMLIGGKQGKVNDLGTPIKVNEAKEYIFGYVLVNDWSARDFQVWEYVPLGPFNAKNFATTMSAWIVTSEALSQFKVDLEKQDPTPLPYLNEKEHTSYDINLEVYINQGDDQNLVSTSNFKYLYWSPSQQLAHHSVTGCNMQTGDMLASGTISGPTDQSLGCLLEATKSGTQQLSLANGQQRTFLQDGDQVVLKGYQEKNGVRIGFGECEGKVVKAHDESLYY